MNTRETKNLIQEVIRNLRASDPCPHWAVRLMGNLRLCYAEYSDLEWATGAQDYEVHTPVLFKFSELLSKEQTLEVFAKACAGKGVDPDTRKYWLDIITGKEDWEDPNDESQEA